MKKLEAIGYVLEYVHEIVWRKGLFIDSRFYISKYAGDITGLRKC